MSEEVLIRQCAPTIAGIKTGSLFTCPYEDKDELKKEVRAFNRKYASKGLCLIPLRFNNDRVLLYMYRPEGLSHDLQDSLAREVLEQEGYPWDNSSKCVARLMKKFRESKDFPHEIGLFLSYPPEDVKGFIDNNAHNYKCSGIWKVYGDVNKAQTMFSRFKRCTETYCRMWKNGSCFEQLTVSRSYK